MSASVVTIFIVYLVLINPAGKTPIVLAVTEAQDRTRKLCTTVEGTSTAIILFFALCRAWILAYLNITGAAFKIASGIIL